LSCALQTAVNPKAAMARMKNLQTINSLEELELGLIPPPPQVLVN
jgi:hypothetical protein